MKCSECNLYYAGRYDDFPRCQADPNWPAPCECEEDYSEVEDEDLDLIDWSEFQ